MHLVIPPECADHANSALIVFFNHAAHTADESHVVLHQFVEQLFLFLFFSLLNSLHPSGGYNMASFHFTPVVWIMEVHLLCLFLFTGDERVGGG